MSVDTHVPGGPAQALPFTIRDMLLGLWVPILLSHAKIYDMDNCEREK
jgi:hypothetical protein